MNNLILLLFLGAFMIGAMAFAWSIARRPGKSGWTDTIWSYATGAGGIIAALAASGPIERRLLVAVMIGGWSLRLGTHILKRTLKGKDDPRYAELKREWGAAWEAKLFRFLMIQAAAGWVLLLSILAAASNPAPALAWSDWAGLALLLASVAGAGIADRQLRAFAAEPVNKGKVMDEGLWAWSRHPNYFFEWTGWFAYALIAIGPALGWPWGWVALSGPAFIYWLLVRASGIPPTEAHMLRSRGGSFRSYQKRVNAFFPGPPKSS
ncbi:MAG: DUF1295 domain-containing protein [Sphingomicrobium sp.]